MKFAKTIIKINREKDTNAKIIKNNIKKKNKNIIIFRFRYTED